MTKQQTDAAYVAACGLYCGACTKYVKGKCPGCRENGRASWCAVRSCCLERGYASCADCTIVPLAECRKFNFWVAKVFSALFRSDRAACIARIREIGPAAFAQEMGSAGRMTIRRGKKRG